MAAVATAAVVVAALVLLEPLTFKEEEELLSVPAKVSTSGIILPDDAAFNITGLVSESEVASIAVPNALLAPRANCLAIPKV